MILSIDIETKSSVDLTKCGVYPYSEDKNFKILLIAYAFDDEEVSVIDLEKGEQLPGRLSQAILDPKITKYAFNANFERVCLSKYLNTYLEPKSFKCTQAMALRLGLPYSLDSVSEILNLDVKKDKEGKSLIKYFNNHNPSDDLVKWEKFKNYCKRDCIVERDIRRKLEKYKTTPFEEEVYIIDQKINDRGVSIDKKLIDKAIELNLYSEKILKEKLKTLTNIDNIKSPSQVKKYLVEKHNIKINSLSKENVEKLIKETKDESLKEILTLRQMLSKTSIKKYEAMKRTISNDNTIKGLFKYYKANKTGRWSGKLVQVQNLPQTNFKNMDLPRNILKENNTNDSYELLEILYENTQIVLSNLIRTAFIPGKNKKLIISDFSAIEARVLSYISREKWRIEVFNTHGKIYEANAAKMFNVDINTISKDSKLRQSGKIAELALGYQGGINALIKMGADKMGLSKFQMESIVKSYRKANINIVNFWKSVERASISCVKYKTNVKFNNLEFIYGDNYMFIVLPSNRPLAYFNPKIEIDKNFNREVLTYKSINQTTKRFEKTYTYGGKLTENIVQAISRDILALKMIDLENNGYEIVMHVHDEVVLEVDEDVNVDKINTIMEKDIDYLNGLKLKVDTGVSYYYKK